MRCNACGATCESTDRFCYQCGVYLKKPISLTTNINTDNVDLIGSLFSFLSIFILVLAVFIYFFSTRTGKLYLNDSLYTSSSYEESTSLYGYYKTSIDYDTVFKKEEIFSINDGKELILNHSNTQKETCQKKSIVEIENRISTNFNITAVNLCEMENKVVLELEKILTKVFNIFPETLGYMSNITLMNPKVDDNFIAAYIPIFEFANSNLNIKDYPLVTKSMLILNSNYFLNYSFLDNTVKKASEIGYFPPNAYGMSSIAHELGHYISFVALLKENDVDSLVMVDKDSFPTALKISNAVSSGSFSHDIIKKAYNNYQINYPSENLSETDFCSLISDYAISSIYDETIAEAVHDYFLNDTNASLASIEIINVLKNILGGTN